MLWALMLKVTRRTPEELLSFNIIKRLRALPKTLFYHSLTFGYAKTNFTDIAVLETPVQKPNMNIIVLALVFYSAIAGQVTYFIYHPFLKTTSFIEASSPRLIPRWPLLPPRTPLPIITATVCATMQFSTLLLAKVTRCTPRCRPDHDGLRASHPLR